MKKTTAPNKKTPSPTAQTQRSPSAVFIAAALDMSWRLAIVVLVPIIGGFELDQALDMSPLLTIVGFLIAMVGMGLVLWQMLQTVNQLPSATKGKHS